MREAVICGTTPGLVVLSCSRRRQRILKKKAVKLTGPSKKEKKKGNMVSTSSFRSIIDHGTRCVSSRQCAPCSNELAKVFRVKIWSNDCHIDNVCLLCDFFFFLPRLYIVKENRLCSLTSTMKNMCILLYTLFTFILNTVNQECDLASVQSVKQTNASMCSCCAAFLKIFFF